MKRLVHKGVRVLAPPPSTDMRISIRGQEYTLDAVQEQMAMAFVAKRHLKYWQDQVFVRNFLKDFCKALGVKPVLTPQEVDLERLFAEGIDRWNREQRQKEAMSKEERKALTAKRKADREDLQAIYGHAEIDGERVEISNWTAEPSCIFMGRGEHPLRGRWKPGPREEDITLNLSPDAELPEGKWTKREWQSDSLWIARWQDKLSGKMKYVWVSDTASIKQDREAQKFEVSQQLAKQIRHVQRAIQEGMQAKSLKRRQIATACYLIDALSLRVGDEKDPDEADTVGATTLRPEHVTIKENGEVEFQFLGKDSVPWHKTATLPADVVHELMLLIDNARSPNRSSRKGRSHPMWDRPQIFPDVRSRNVNAFLNDIMPGLTAKVFRTYHASSTVRRYLSQVKVTRKDPAWVKANAAKRANLQAAIVCNHTKQAPKGWSTRVQRFRERQHKANARVSKAQENLTKRQERLKELLAKQKEKLAQFQAQGKPIPRGTNRPFSSSIASARRSVETAKHRLARAIDAKAKVKDQIDLAKKTRTWNLGTSLKSYIDPRIYRDWGHQVDYDWKAFYPKTLQRKFAWVDQEEDSLAA
ncbi:MAG: DNA topoisomerase I [Candidatus Hodarchaeota archaeon]